MNALTQGRILGDAIERYLKKKKQWEDYRVPKVGRQFDRAAEELAQAFASFSPADGVGAEDEPMAQRHLREIGVIRGEGEWQHPARGGQWGHPTLGVMERGNHQCLSEDWLLENLPNGWSYDCQVHGQEGFTITAGDGETLFLPLRLLAPPPPERSAA